MPRAPFITFEGSEGCGKSTQVQRLTARLQSLDVPLLVTREPGGTELGETIRDLLKFAPQGQSMTPESELLLFAASRSQLVREKIVPALESGVVVISDRFADSTTVYQGVARKLDTELVAQVNGFAVGDCWPNVTFVLDLEAEVALDRLRRRLAPDGIPDRMEQEPLRFYEDVRRAYLRLAQTAPERVQVLDASHSADELEAEIWNTVTIRFPNIAGAVASLA